MFGSLRAKLESAGSNIVTGMSVRDLRFPTSRGAHGSDAIHKDPDYSMAYVILSVDGLAVTGHGYTFTLGRGTEVSCLLLKTKAARIHAWSQMLQLAVILCILSWDLALVVLLCVWWVVGILTLSQSLS